MEIFLHFSEYRKFSISPGCMRKTPSPHSSEEMKEAIPSTFGQKVIAKTEREHVSPRITSFLFRPVLASVIQDRRITLVLVGVAALQLCLAAIGFPGWQCPVKSLLGMPCPGCGLSTAMVLLIQGELRVAMTVHAFAPVFLLGFIIIAAVGILPERLHREIVRRIASLEQGTGFTTLLIWGP